MKLVVIWLSILLLPAWLTVADLVISGGDPNSGLPGSLLYVSILIALGGSSSVAFFSHLKLYLKLLAVPATAILLAVEVLLIGVVLIMYSGLDGVQ